jgi:hypothetical protein
VSDYYHYHQKCYEAHERMQQRRRQADAERTARDHALAGRQRRRRHARLAAALELLRPVRQRTALNVSGRWTALSSIGLAARLAIGERLAQDHRAPPRPGADQRSVFQRGVPRTADGATHPVGWQRKPPFPGAFSLGGAGIEPATSCL